VGACWEGFGWVRGTALNDDLHTCTPN
jgi:hypothetical protein